MSFATILRSIVQDSGGLGAALMGNDGIPIEQVVLDSVKDPLAEDIATAGVEFGRILGEIRKASDGVSGGGVDEIAISLARFLLIFRVIDEDTFVMVVLPPDGNTGKARYLIRRQLPAICREL